MVRDNADAHGQVEGGICCVSFGKDKRLADLSDASRTFTLGPCRCAPLFAQATTNSECNTNLQTRRLERLTIANFFAALAESALHNERQSFGRNALTLLCRNKVGFEITIMPTCNHETVWLSNLHALWFCRCVSCH